MIDEKMACIGFKLPSFKNAERVAEYKPREERRQELPVMPYDKMVMPYPYPFGNQFLHGSNFGFMPWCPWMLNTASSRRPMWHGAMMGNGVPPFYHSF